MMGHSQLSADHPTVWDRSIVAGRYRIEGVLGIGGMGVVYRAEHLLLGDAVALKFMHARYEGIPEARERFLREARSQFRIASPHVVRVLDVGETESGAPFIAMEYVDGPSLKDVMSGGDIDLSTACAIARQVCEGLASAHAIGVVHRDIKPANVMLTRSALGAPCAKIIDFGIAQADVDAEQTRITATSTVMGTPSYMAPEQLRATRMADERSDIWSVGATLYELLTGRVPYESDSPADLIVQQIGGSPPLASKLRKDVPEKLARLVDECFVFDANERRMTAPRLAEALAPFADASFMAPMRPKSGGRDVTLRRRKIRNTAGRTAFEMHELVAPGGTQALEPPRTVPPPKRTHGVQPRAFVTAGAIGGAAAFVIVASLTAALWPMANVRHSRDAQSSSFPPADPLVTMVGSIPPLSSATSATVEPPPTAMASERASAVVKTWTTAGRKAPSSPPSSPSIDPYVFRR